MRAVITIINLDIVTIIMVAKNKLKSLIKIIKLTFAIKIQWRKKKNMIKCVFFFGYKMIK